MFIYNFFDEITTIKSSKKIPDGLSSVKIDFKYDGGGQGKRGDFNLYVNSDKVGEARVDATVPARFGIDTFGIGFDSGSPVTHYKTNKYEGHIVEVNI